MWICQQCGERHQDQFKECWKCFGKEDQHAIAEKPLPLPAPTPERKLRTTASILFRVVAGFLVGTVLGTAILPRYGVPIAEAMGFGVAAGVAVGFFVGVILWVVFPYLPDDVSRAGAGSTEIAEDARSQKPE